MKAITDFDTCTLRSQEERKRRQEERRRKKQESFNKQQVKRSESDALVAYNKNKKIWDEAHPEEIEEEEPPIPTVVGIPQLQAKKPAPPETETGTKGSSMSVALALSSCLSLSKSGLDFASKCARGAKVNCYPRPRFSSTRATHEHGPTYSRRI